MYSNEIEIENYSAYIINDPKEPVYIVQWESKPWKVDADGSNEVDGHTYKWTEGDYLCGGAWLKKLDGGRNWYTMDSASRKCIVNFEKVVNANIDMCPFADSKEENSLPP